MVMLARLPVSGELPASPDRLLLDSRSLAFRSLDGRELLTSGTADLFVIMEGLTGIDLLDREPVLSQRAFVDGALLSELKVGVRNPFVPILIWSDGSHEAFLDLADRLASFAQHRRVDLTSTDGVFDLVATSIRGERSLRVSYLSGWAGEYSGEMASAHWLKAGFQLLAAAPYWRGAAWGTPTIRPASDAGWFGTFPGELSSSVAFSRPMEIIVGGDGPTFAQVEVAGPADTVSIDAGDGFSVELPGGLVAGEIFTLDSDLRRPSVLVNGVDAWDRVGPGFRTEAFLPGVATVTIGVTGTSIQSSARVFGVNQHERPW